ncbi:MarC family protein [Aliiroseovarius sp. S1123]|jgi:multiple antibiotic resistance protein|uniref:MarC family protein n=1 Tax=unclassified Aliiroseovarius TaxID=2623558 RepID=UPI001FF43C17|nr:MarC family protein [Aliiroseovarius sp. S1123]MCK0170500.1 MarC family protein [Aliiroseovarius sp. S1123]
MDIDLFVPSFVTLFVVMDPIGISPLFMALTQGMSTAKRRAVAIRACLIAGVLLTLFAFLGEGVLGFLGISMPAFRIAGGILLLLTALDMLFERRTQRRKDQSEETQSDDDPSVFPLAMPLIAGPGSIATVILLAGQGDGLEGVGLALVVMSLVLVIAFVLFNAAPLLERILRETGIKVVTRLLGMLLAALAVQFVLEGLRDFGLMG